MGHVTAVDEKTGRKFYLDDPDDLREGEPVRKFGHDELVRFLQALDGEVSQPVDVVVVGGAAASLAYGVTRATRS